MSVIFFVFSCIVASVESFPLSRYCVPSGLHLYKKMGVKFLTILLCLQECMCDLFENRKASKFLFLNKILLINSSIEKDPLNGLSEF